MTMPLKVREWLESSNTWNCLLKVHSYANQQIVPTLHNWINVDLLTIKCYLSVICLQFGTDCLQCRFKFFPIFNSSPISHPISICLLPTQTMFPNMEDAEINSRLVGYCSDQVIYKDDHWFDDHCGYWSSDDQYNRAAALTR